VAGFLQRRRNKLNLIIEITRQCNLECHHCLRGDKQNISIQKRHVEQLFSHLSEIDCLTLTGGEPALRPDKIQMILEVARDYDIDIRNFYVATNGTIASKKFLQSIFDLWCYCSENEISCLDVSNDCFHDTDLIEENIQRFKAFSFAKYKYFPKSYNYQDCNERFPDYTDEDFESLLGEGRGINYNNRKPSIVTKEKFLEDPHDYELYLNCNGDLILGCNWSYENQENHKLCHVNDFGQYAYCLEEENYD
jgi:hypothetical protein